MQSQFDWILVQRAFWMWLGGNVLLLGLAVRLCPKLPVPWAAVMRFVILVLALRILLVGNPVSWHWYKKWLPPPEVGWRQASVITKERDRYLVKRSGVRYLAVGSSQTDAVYSAYSEQHDELAMFTMAAMAPLDFVLYRSHIARYKPTCILLYLSDFDMVPLQSPLSVAMAPRQGLNLVSLWLEIQSFPEGKLYSHALMEMLVGELFPEFKYGFVFRALVEKAFRRMASSIGEDDPPSPRRRATLQQRIEWLRDSMRGAHIDFNMTFLHQFLAHMASHGIKIVIVEGYYNPLVHNVDTRQVSRVVREKLQALALEFEHVYFVPRADIYEFSETDYEDLSHVKPKAGYEFTRRLVALLDRGILASSSRLANER